MNPGSMPSGGGNTPNIGGGTNGGGFDAKSQAISQADNMLGKYVSNTPDVGEKVGLSKKEAKEVSATKSMETTTKVGRRGGAGGKTSETATTKKETRTTTTKGGERKTSTRTTTSRGRK